MKLFKYIGRSIGLTQAIAMLIVSLVIGFGLSALQLGYTLIQQRQEAVDFSQEILILAEGGATTAAWTLDPDLAEEVVKSMMGVGGVREALISDENGAVLARAVSDAPDRDSFVHWFARTFIGDEIQARRELHVTVGDRVHGVGMLSVALDLSFVVGGFLALAIRTVIATVVQALLIGGMLLWLSSCLVTGPLHRIAKTIAAVDPERPDAMALSIPSLHEHNELGDLLARTNQMLKRLSTTQEELRTLATRDTLTDLPNRAVITTILTTALSRAQRGSHRLAVLFLDLDRFKNINDSFGHDVGDALLVAVAARLTRAVRAHDSVGRLGGDEFLIVLESISDKGEAATIVQRIAHALHSPIALGSHEVRTAASIGIALFPDHAQDADMLIRQADLAMYNAKQEGRAHWSFFAPEMSDHLVFRLQIETALAQALEKDELRLVFQPKLDARRGHLVGCEALLRWHNGGEVMAAGSFITVAEETGIIVEIGHWVLDQVCQRIAQWSQRFGSIPVSLNISSRQLHAHDFVSEVLETAKRHDIDPHLLELEIRESILVEDLERNIELLRQLRDNGVMISIDDFGTGYSSLSYLTRLPIHSLKIDKSFVSGSQSCKAVLEMVIAMADTLQFDTVAEGVETNDQRNWLIARGCDVLQGNLLSEPLAADEFERRFLNEPAAQWRALV